MIFRRKILEELKSRKDDKKKKPLIIKGLRQVGKTSIVKEFARKNYENAFILDFRKQRSLSTYFDGDFDINKISLFISSLDDSNRIIKNSKLIPYKTVLIFDEIQDCPNARSSLKYFKEDGRFDVIATGSLLGIKGYNNEVSSFRGIGVGNESELIMTSMDFEEFLWANNVDSNLIDYIKDCYINKREINSFVHNLFLDWIKKYIVVGGLPEVVATFVDTNDLKEVKKVKKYLFKTYESDFGTHLNKDLELKVDESLKLKIMQVFKSIPRQLGKENNKFQFSYISHNARKRDYESAITWLYDYGLIDISYNLNSLSSPLSFFSNDEHFKIFFSDIGLLTGSIDEDIDSKILTDTLKMGKGIIYESLIADSLHKAFIPLYYFSKSSGLEIDFISSLNNKIYLVEVKARNGNTKASKIILNSNEDKYNEVEGLIKFTSSNIGIVNKIFTIPYYLSFYFFTNPIDFLNR